MNVAGLEPRADLSFLSFTTGSGSAIHEVLRTSRTRSAGRVAERAGGPATGAGAATCTDESARGAVRRNRIVGFVNPHVFNVAFEDADVRRFLERSDLLCVDGLGIVLAVLATRGRRLPRCVAEHAFRRLVEELDVQTEAVLIGTTPGEVERAARAMNAASGALSVIDTLDGFAGDEATRRFLRRHATVPLVLIGAGSPTSERIGLMADALCRGATVFHIGGGTIKTWAGTKRRAPALVSALGIEWLHRLAFEPHTRRRYALGGPLFLRNLLRRPRTDGPTGSRERGERMNGEDA